MDFRVLGPVELRVDGQPRPLRPRATLLLALLILKANRAITGETLADLLWMGDPPRTAASALRVHLADLRAALRPSPEAPSRLATTAAGYVLTIEDDELDAERFERRLALAAEPSASPAIQAQLLRAGLDEWRGAPYQGFDDIEELAVARVYLERRLEQLRLALADADLESRRYAQVAADTVLWLRDAPTSEAIASRRAIALHRSGDQVEALRTWRRFVDALRDDYGLEPTPDFLALERVLLEPPAPTEAPPLPVVARADTVAAGLVQRDDLIDEALASFGTDAHRPDLLVITGSAGMGKSAVLAALAEGLPDPVLVTVRPADQPLAAPLDVLRTIGAPDLEVARFSATAALEDRVTALATVLLQQLRSGACGAVLVDNADDLDPDSLAVFQRVIDHRPQPVSWVATCRTERAPFGTDSALLARTRHFALAPLDSDGIGRILHRHGVEPTDEIVATTAAQTGGVPFLVVSSARHLATGRSIAELPSASLTHIQALLGHVPTDDREVLELASVLPPGPLDVALLAESSRRSLTDVIETIERAIAIGLLDDRFHDGLGFRHAISRDAVEASLSGPRRSSAHVAVATALLERDDARALDIAHHLRAAARPDLQRDAAIWTAREAEDAMAQGAVLRAAERFELAVSLGRDARVGDEVVLGWQLRHADALVASGSLIDARSTAMAVAEAARRLGDAELFAEAAIRLVGPMIPTGSARDAAEDHLVAALEWLPDQADPRVTRVAEALARSMIGHDDETVEQRAAGIRPVLRRAAELATNPQEQATALLGLRSLAWAEHRAPSDRVRLSTAAVAAAQRAADPVLLMATHRVAAADLFEAADRSLGARLDSYWNGAHACGAAFHGWLSSRIGAAWAHACGDDVERKRLLDRARPLAVGLDPRVVQRAELEAVVADHMLLGTLAELAPFATLSDDLDEEVTVLTQLLFMAIRTAAGERVRADAIAALFERAPHGPLRVGAATFVALALPGADGDERGELARAVIDVLEPATGSMVILDGGVACIGPVDMQLASCHRVRGNETGFEYHRDVAASVVHRFAPAWHSRAKGESE